MGQIPKTVQQYCFSIQLDWFCVNSIPSTTQICKVSHQSTQLVTYQEQPSFSVAMSREGGDRLWWRCQLASAYSAKASLIKVNTLQLPILIKSWIKKGELTDLLWLKTKTSQEQQKDLHINSPQNRQFSEAFVHKQPQRCEKQHCPGSLTSRLMSARNGMQAVFTRHIA